MAEERTATAISRPPLMRSNDSRISRSSRGGNGVARIHWRMRAPTLASVLDIVDVERRELLGDASGEALVLQEVAIGLRGGREAIGHVDAGLREVADHLAEGGVLAADGLDVVPAELGEGNGVGGHVGAHVNLRGSCS